MGTIVTLDLPADSPVLDLPWIITFGPLADDEEWEPVVSGPYERLHALALAQEVVADDELMAVVEPVLPHVSAEEIRGEIAAAKLAVPDELDEDADSDGDHDHHHDHHHDDHGDAGDGFQEEIVPPTVEQIREGFARIAASLIRR